MQLHTTTILQILGTVIKAHDFNNPIETQKNPRYRLRPHVMLTTGLWKITAVFRCVYSVITRLLLTLQACPALKFVILNAGLHMLIYNVSLTITIALFNFYSVRFRNTFDMQKRYYI